MKRILWSLILICALALPVAAHAVPDLDRQGSIRITMRYDGRPVSGGEFTIYRVGGIREADGNFDFVLTEEFSAAGVSLDSVSSAQTAKKLCDFAKKQKLSGEKRKISTLGTVLFEDLQPGLYLLVQNKAAEGYYAVNPFLVSLPMLEKASYSYHIDASPKVSPLPVTPPDNPEQPKTGQPVWPIWTFAASGAALVMLLRRKSE